MGQEDQYAGLCPNIDAVCSVKIIHKQRHVFISEEIHRLFNFADIQMKAMILLGLNCGLLGGYANQKMVTRHVQDVSKQTDRVIKNSRKCVI